MTTISNLWAALTFSTLYDSQGNFNLWFLECGIQFLDLKFEVQIPSTNSLGLVNEESKMTGKKKLLETIIDVDKLVGNAAQPNDSSNVIFVKEANSFPDAAQQGSKVNSNQEVKMFQRKINILLF